MPDKFIPKQETKSFLIILSCLIVLFTLLHVYLSWARGTNLHHVSAAWTTLALDLANGVFYRPLFSEEIGYGGTRFFPLYFSLHAALLMVTEDPVLAGCILSVSASLFLLAGMYVLLKRSGAETWVAAVFTTFVLAGFSMQTGFTSIRGDILPIALNTWGLIFCIDPKKSKPLISAIFFTLAFSAKVTALYGVIAVFFLLYCTHHRKKAWLLCLYTSLGLFIVASAMYIGSSGRILSIMSVCASGGASAWSIIKAPLNLFYHLIKNDFPLFCIFCFAVFRLFTMPPEKRITLPVIYWLSAFAVTLFIFGSPGTASNHLADLHFASILILACHFAGSRTVHKAQAIPLVLIGIVFLAPIAIAVLKPQDQTHREKIRAVISFVDSQAQSGKPVLSENAFIPILAGEKIYLQDAFTFRLMKMNDSSLASPLYTKLEKGGFKAVVFTTNPQNPEWHPHWYEKVHFGENFVKAVRKRYVFAENHGNYHIYIPK